MTVEGDIVGHRQADVLRVKTCNIKNCARRGSLECLIGKDKESTWGVCLN